VGSAATTPQWPYLKKGDPDTVALRAPLAQLAEQLTLNQRVGGSIPSRRTQSGQFHRATVVIMTMSVRFSDQHQRWRLRGPVLHAGRSDFTDRARHRELGVRLGVAATPARLVVWDIDPCPQAAAQPYGDTFPVLVSRSGMTSGAVWVPLRLFTETMYPPSQA
jgi:hypothetical protein